MRWSFVTFSLGLSMGLLFSFFSWPFHPTLIESSLSQVLYNNIKPYGTKDYRLNTVLQMVTELAEQKRLEIPISEVYGPLEALAVKQIEEESATNLQQAEMFIETLKNRHNTIPVVNDRVYAEILEEGNGEVVNSKDVIEIRFKEYNLRGDLLKDTAELQPIEIPLSQTIKGFQLGLNGMKIGERRKLYIHPEYGFGKISHSETNRLLIYEVIVSGKRS